MCCRQVGRPPDRPSTTTNGGIGPPDHRSSTTTDDSLHLGAHVTRLRLSTSASSSSTSLPLYRISPAGASPRSTATTHGRSCVAPSASELAPLPHCSTPSHPSCPFSTPSSTTQPPPACCAPRAPPLWPCCPATHSPATSSSLHLSSLCAACATSVWRTSCASANSTYSTASCTRPSMLLLLT